jgi:hypothetical protein
MTGCCTRRKVPQERKSRRPVTSHMGRTHPSPGPTHLVHSMLVPCHAMPCHDCPPLMVLDPPLHISSPSNKLKMNNEVRVRQSHQQRTALAPLTGDPRDFIFRSPAGDDRPSNQRDPLTPTSKGPKGTPGSQWPAPIPPIPNRHARA